MKPSSDIARCAITSPIAYLPLSEGKTVPGASIHRGGIRGHATVPQRDRFQVVTEHSAATLQFDRHYLDIERSDQFVMVRVTLSAGRTAEAKSAFYARLAELLAECIELRPEDLAVILVENERTDWSFGRGQASYVVIPREQWR
jgi:4-oxalocrotonate tautomerase